MALKGRANKNRHVTDKDRLHVVCRILLAGVPQYGLVVNPQKVVVNFPVSESVGPCPGIRMLPPHCLFPWCGLLLDTSSLDVYKDYSRWSILLIALKSLNCWLKWASSMRGYWANGSAPPYTSYCTLYLLVNVILETTPSLAWITNIITLTTGGIISTWICFHLMVNSHMIVTFSFSFTSVSSYFIAMQACLCATALLWDLSTQQDSRWGGNWWLSSDSSAMPCSWTWRSGKFKSF